MGLGSKYMNIPNIPRAKAVICPPNSHRSGWRPAWTKCRLCSVKTFLMGRFWRACASWILSRLNSCSKNGFNLLRRATRTGRPLVDHEHLTRIEKKTGRNLQRGNQDRNPRIPWNKDVSPESHCFIVPGDGEGGKADRGEGWVRRETHGFGKESGRGRKIKLTN